MVIETDGTLTYTPDENFSGQDTINYTISDGNGGTASATVSVMVNGVADAPALAAPTSLETLDLAEIDLGDLVARLVDQDGSERLKVKFSGLPEGAVILNKEAIAAKDAKIKELETELVDLADRIEVLQGQIDELTGRIEDLNANDPTSPQIPILEDETGRADRRGPGSERRQGGKRGRARLNGV